MQLLHDCEQGLRKLVADAAGEGDYSGVQRIADLAKAIAALGAEGRAIPSPPPASPTTVPAAPTAPRPSQSIGRRSRSPVEPYPRFLRRGDELVKVGWSKKDRKEYHHRAPRKAVDAVAAAVRQVGARGKRFNGDALLPLKDPTDGTPVPDYQAYVGLAWLKHLGLVKQIGRRAGYTLVPDRQIDGTITTAWPELAEWRG